MADVPRRVRTQAERDTDGTTWRATAATRPGYATYPSSAPGSPSWWLRYGEPETHHHKPHRPPHLGPAPVDGETCTQWCGFCHLGTGVPAPTPAPPPFPGEPDNSPITGDFGPVPAPRRPGRPDPEESVNQPAAHLTGSAYVRAVVDQLIALDVPVDLNGMDLDEEQCNIPIANFDEIVWLRWLDDREHGWHFTTPGGERCAAICAPDTSPAEAARILVNYV